MLEGTWEARVNKYDSSRLVDLEMLSDLEFWKLPYTPGALTRSKAPACDD